MCKIGSHLLQLDCLHLHFPPSIIAERRREKLSPINSLDWHVEEVSFVELFTAATDRINELKPFSVLRFRSILLVAARILLGRSDRAWKWRLSYETPTGEKSLRHEPQNSPATSRQHMHFMLIGSCKHAERINFDGLLFRRSSSSCCSESKPNNWEMGFDVK